MGKELTAFCFGRAKGSQQITQKVVQPLKASVASTELGGASPLPMAASVLGVIIGCIALFFPPEVNLC